MKMGRNKSTFEAENLTVDWITLNIEGLTDPSEICFKLAEYFIPQIFIDNEKAHNFSVLDGKYYVYIRQYTQRQSKQYWVGTQIMFTGENAAYFYKLIKSGDFDLKNLSVDQNALNLGRIDLCYSQPNVFNSDKELFDAFLVDSRTQVKTKTKSRHIKLQDFPDGKVLKVNRRNNALHYRAYQKNKTICFELELKHHKAKSVQDYLFQNQLTIFEDKLIWQFFKYSNQVLCENYPYTDWILDFYRRNNDSTIFQPFLLSYLENQSVKGVEDDKLYHLLQFLNFVKSLNLNPFRDCKKTIIKGKVYYELEFPLVEFIKFIGVKIKKQSERVKLINYFDELQTLKPIVYVFSNVGFRSYVCFPYAGCVNPTGRRWIVEVLVAEELFCYPYPFQLPTIFFNSTTKNDLRLKLFCLRSLAVPSKIKTLDFENFFNTVVDKQIRQDSLIQIKKNIIKLLSELVRSKIITDDAKIIMKNGAEINVLIHELTVSNLTRRISCIKLYEIF